MLNVSNSLNLTSYSSLSCNFHHLEEETLRSQTNRRRFQRQENVMWDNWLDEFNKNRPTILGLGTVFTIRRTKEISQKVVKLTLMITIHEYLWSFWAEESKYIVSVSTECGKLTSFFHRPLSSKKEVIRNKILDIIQRPLFYLKHNVSCRCLTQSNVNKIRISVCLYLTGNTLRLRYETNRLMLSIGLWRWYINITITILGIIHRSFI
jgi:hypothetical protein